MSSDSTVVQLRPNQDISNAKPRLGGNYHTELRHGDGNGGGDDMQVRVAKLESDVSYIQRDIADIKSDVKSIDSRLVNIEQGISSLKATFKVCSGVAGVVFALCAYVFGSYVSKIIDALNGLVLK